MSSLFLLFILFISSIAGGVLAANFVKGTGFQSLVGFLVGVLMFMSGFVLKSMVQVEPTQVKFPKLFGEVVQDEYYLQGLHFNNPLYEYETVNIGRSSIELTGPSTLKGPAMGGIKIDVMDLSLPFKRNPEMVTKIRVKVGTGVDNMLLTNARAAGRLVMAKKTWNELSYGDKSALGEEIRQAFEGMLIADLVKSGLTDAEAKLAFTIYPVLVRNVEPDGKILESKGEEEAAKVDLSRQKTLTAIAEEEANRRKNEGTGINKMFAELPQELSKEDIAMIINANANKTRSEALMKCVETKCATTFVIGGAGMDMALPAARK